MVVLLTTASLEGQHLAKSFFNTGLLGAAGSSAPSDDQFNRVSFLSHFEGSNNGVNNAFDDSSSSNHTITANGNVTQGSFGPFARPDGEWGVDFEDGDSLAVASSSDFNFGTSNFTWECFVFQKSRSAFQLIMAQDDYSSGNSISCWLTDTGQASIYYEGGGTHFTTTATVPLNTWTHLAWVRKGTGTNEFSIYIDGTAEVSGTMTTSFDQDGIIIGQQANGNYDFIGNISNIRIVNGSAVYTGNFTPSTSKLTAVTNTKLLTCQSNRFVDNSASAHTLTPSGNPTVTSFGPFLTSSVYKPAVNGASAYFDGSGDYLTLPPQSDFAFGTGDFSVSLWVYFNEAENFDYLIDGRNSGQTTDTWSLSINFTNGAANKLMFASIPSGGSATAVLTSNTDFVTGQWYYISVSRSGTTSRMHFNGTQVAINSSDSTNYSTAPNTSYIGTRYSIQQYFDGYMCDVRVVKGTALSSYTPPTAPLTAITNTKLLLNMADGQAIDSAAQNNLKLYGTAKTSTAQKKFGTASLLLDGNSDYVHFADADAGSMFNFGATKWTIEGWFYQENDAGSSSNSHSIISRWNNQNSDKGFIFRVTDSSGQKLQWLHTTDGSTNVVYTDSRTISNDTWYHFALVKNDNLTLYLNGTGAVLNSSTFTIVSTTIPTLIGSVHESGSPSQYFDGYIDDLRVSHMARYTSDFTAPTAAFPDKGQ